MSNEKDKPQLYLANEELLPTGEHRDALLDTILSSVSIETRIQNVINTHTEINMSDKEFEIPRDENGKIDISKLPEEMRDTLELIGYLFTESTPETEAIIEQTIKVYLEDTDKFRDLVSDISEKHQRNLRQLGPDRTKAEMFDFSRPIRHQQILSALTDGEKVHYGVLSTEEELKKQGYKTMPNRSMGESEYIRPEDRNALLTGYTMEEQMGMKLPVNLLKTMSEASDAVIPTGFDHLNKMIEGGVRREDLVVFGGRTEVSPNSVFNSTRARRHLYKSLLDRMNKEIDEGPLKGVVSFTGVTNATNGSTAVQFVFSVEWTYKARNRMKAFNTYFMDLKAKYMREIKEAEAKVMERE